MTRHAHLARRGFIATFCLAAIFFMLLLLPFLGALAADPAAPPTIGDAVGAAAATQPVWDFLWSRYPWLANVVLVLGALRLVLKPVFLALHGDGTTPEQQARETPAFRIVAWLLDYCGSIKVRAIVTPPCGSVVAVLFAVGFAAFLSGCATAGPATSGPVPPANLYSEFNISNLTPLVDSAAYSGTRALLIAHPEKRGVFVQASDALSVLIAEDKVTLVTLKVAVDPILSEDIRELRDPNTALEVDGAIAVVDTLLGRYELKYDTEQPQVLAVAKAARNGIVRALAVTVVPSAQ